MGLEICICLIWPLAYSQFSFIYEYRIVIGEPVVEEVITSMCTGWE
jgi:hypothetical protein